MELLLLFIEFSMNVTQMSICNSNRVIVVKSKSCALILLKQQVSQLKKKKKEKRKIIMEMLQFYTYLHQ